MLTRNEIELIIGAITTEDAPDEWAPIMRKLYALHDAATRAARGDDPLGLEGDTLITLPSSKEVTLEAVTGDLTRAAYFLAEHEDNEDAQGMASDLGTAVELIGWLAAGDRS